MRPLRWATLAWPGLPQLWIEGAWSGLFIAIGFGLLLNATLAITLVWTELLGSEVRLGAWVAVTAVWLGAMVVSWVQMPRPVARPPDLDTDALFCQAQREYLSGNWYLAQTSLDMLLQVDPEDAEARLMLATLLRRTGRPDLARTELSKLETSDRGARWGAEIAREFSLLSQAIPAEEEVAESLELTADSPIERDSAEQAA